MKWVPAIALLATLAMLAACADNSVAIRKGDLPAEVIAQPQDFLLVTVSNQPATLAAAGSTPRAYGASGAYVVGATAINLVAAIARDYRLQPVASWPIDALAMHCVVFRRPADRMLTDLLTQLGADPRVRLAQPLQTFKTLTSYNDPYAPLQSSLEALGLERAHRVSRGDGVKLVLIDTGVDTGHADLAGQVVAVRNFVDHDSEAFRRDLHGTEVAGVIAARANNHIGIVGVAPAIKLTAMKACWQTVENVHAVCNSFTLAQALSAALSSGADIVNLSLAGPADPLLEALLRWGLSRGIIFVAAVPASGRIEGFPAGVPGVLATDEAGSSSDTRGVLRAPGDHILTLTPGGHYDFASGSSIAAANLSGVVALLLSHRRLSNSQLRALLISSSSVAQGSINACAALGLLDRSVRDCAPAPHAAQTDKSAEH